MARIRAALSMIMMTLVGPLSLMLPGVVALALYHGDGTGRDGRAVPTHARGASLSDDGEIIHVALEVDERKVSNTMLVHGPGGRDLARFHLYRDGGVTLESTSDPLGFVLHRKASGTVVVVLARGRERLDLQSGTDGPAEIDFKDAGGRILQKMLVGENGFDLSYLNPDRVVK